MPARCALTCPADRAANARGAVTAECLLAHSTQSRSRPSRRSCRPSRSAGWPSTSYVHDLRRRCLRGRSNAGVPAIAIVATLTGAQAEEGCAPRAVGEAIVGTCLQAWAELTPGLTFRQLRRHLEFALHTASRPLPLRMQHYCGRPRTWARRHSLPLAAQSTAPSPSADG